jgi:hypothetical protein
MPLNLEHVGDPICKIVVPNVKKSPVISVTEKNDGIKYPFNELTLKENEKLQCIPNPNTERQIIYITGASGSGKSYWTREYCSEYRKLYKQRPIYLFSSVNEDSSIDAIKGLKRIKLCKELLDEDITAKDFEESLCIFDDTDCLTDKAIKNKVRIILDSILQTGRHFKVSCIYTSHLACDGLSTKQILNECHYMVFFLRSLGGRALKYLLDNYLGMDKEQINKLKQLKGRWICVTRSYPKCIIAEQEIYTL